MLNVAHGVTVHAAKRNWRRAERSNRWLAHTYASYRFKRAVLSESKIFPCSIFVSISRSSLVLSSVALSRETSCSTGNMCEVLVARSHSQRRCSGARMRRTPPSSRPTDEARLIQDSRNGSY